MKEPRWLTAARVYIGQKEIAGRKHNPQILKWWTLIRAGFTDDETPWCAGFVGGVLESCGIKSSRSAAARSYVNWGMPLVKPVVGCIVAFERGPHNGHVGFYTGKDTRGNLLILGGNQGDAVNIKPFAVSRVLAYRWPTGEPFPSKAGRETPIETNEPVSRRESFLSQPDDPGSEEEGEPQTLSAKIKHWTNVVGTAMGGFIAALMSGDWRAVAAVAAVGFLIFCVIWFTQMRRA